MRNINKKGIPHQRHKVSFDLDKIIIRTIIVLQIADMGIEGDDESLKNYFKALTKMGLRDDIKDHLQNFGIYGADALDIIGDEEFEQATKLADEWIASNYPKL